nr:hypothetical protein [Tanacetum cinerariifolium]
MLMVYRCVPSGSSINALTEEIVAYEKDSDETHAVKKLDVLCTPESFVTHSNFDTHGGTVYYILKVSVDVLLVKGNVYDSVDDCVVAYMKYAAEAGFVVRHSCHKRMLNGDVKQKYLVCNRMGFPKGIHVDTLDLKNTDKIKRNSNLHITGCKARTVFNLDSCTKKFVLNVFDTIDNHKLERKEFKHLSKRERQLNYLEQAFILKAASVNIGATRAHHLLTGDSDAQMLILKMENRKKEFGDVVSFDATFKTNKFLYVFFKYKMVSVPFIVIDNHRKCVTIASSLLKNETTKSYIWLLKAFIKAFGKAPSIVVPDQDEAMKDAIEDEFAGSKHRLCMWHITQKLPAKNTNVEMIPQQYILRRWTKNLIPAALRNKRNRYDELRLGAFVEKLKSLKKDVEADCPNPPSKNKTNNLKQLVGVPKPRVDDVNNPTVGSTKGRKKLRIKGGKEKAIEKSLKGKKSCSSCGGTNHNKRTRP